MNDTMGEKINLDLDWSALFPGKIFEIGGKRIDIKPLTLGQISFVTKRIKNILPKIQEKGITFENFGNVENIVELVSIMLDDIPEVLSEFTGLHIETILKFPLDYVVKLVNTALEANIESKELLEKNFKSLAKTFKETFPKIAEDFEKSETKEETEMVN